MMTVAEAGRRGGEQKSKRHDTDHYIEIGERGGEVTAAKGRAHYVALGRKSAAARKSRHVR